MYKKDVKQLRSILGSHVATVNLLLMTQTVGSISAAENDRERLACELQNEILAHRRLLEDVNVRVELSLEQQLETKLQSLEHSIALDNLGSKADQTHKQLHDQQTLIQEVQSMVSNTREQTTSILTAATDIMVLATSGVMKLRLIARQLSRMFELCTRFTTEMRAAMAELLQLFFGLHTILRRIENSLPRRVYLPIVQFTDALGETIPLPYQLCQQWATFKGLLGVIFINRPGKTRVEMGQYLIMNAKGGRLLREASWNHAIKQDDHLSMSIVLDDLEARDGRCPFPSCQASTEGVEVKNGGRTCRECGRWAVLTPITNTDLLVSFNNLPKQIWEESKSDREVGYDSEELEEVKENMEDIEVYRQIHVKTLADEPVSSMSLFDTSPLSSDNEGDDADDEADAHPHVQRRRQSSRRMSQLYLAGEPVFRPLDVLICEDHPVARMVMEKLLEKLRCRTITVSNGAEALRYGMSEIKFDIIMMEFKLPKISGADVARIIRETINANSKTPIVAITGYVKELQVPHYFDALIEKPPTTSKLTEAMRRLCNWKAPAPSQTEQPQKQH
jgi:CheY-like chemotaxis protein